MFDGDDFYVTLSSDESREFFNVKYMISDFTNKLPSAMRLNDNYKVALTEIYIPPFYLPSEENSRNNNDTDENANDDNGNLRRKRRNTSSNEERLEINLPDFDYKIVIDQPLLSRLKGKTYDVTGILLFCLTRMQLFNEETTMTLEEIFGKIYTRREIMEMIAKKFVEDLNTLELDDLHIPIIDSRMNNYINLKIPIAIENEDKENEKIVTKIVKIKCKKYPNFKQFLRDIYRQLPIEERNIVVLVKSIFKITHDTDIPIQKEFREELLKAITDRANGETEKIIDKVFTNKPTINPAASVPLQAESMVSEVNDMQAKCVPEKENQLGSVQAVEKPAVSIQSDVTVNKEPDIDPQLGFHYMKKRKGGVTLNHSHMLFIYTDIIQYSAYAHHSFQILRVIPFYPRKVLEGIHQIFISPEYYPISNYFIENIRIWINNRGEDLRFLNPEMPVYVKLHFKKV